MMQCGNVLLQHPWNLCKFKWYLAKINVGFTTRIEYTRYVHVHDMYVLEGRYVQCNT